MQDPLVFELLDSLGVAVCTFDAHDRALRWNGAFLHFFPEHAGHIHAGESYEDNLRRFYSARLPQEDLPQLERYVAAGLARHRGQTQPYVFQHRGRWLRVASLADASGRRTRIWVGIAAPSPSSPVPFGLPGVASASPFEKIADGVLILDPDGLACSCNAAFAQLYRLGSRDAVLGRSYADLVAQAWRLAEPVDPLDAARRMALLAENLQYQGAPFEVSLPDDRWMRVTMHPSRDGLRYSVHSDITVMIRQQRELRAAEQRARESEARFRGAFDQAGIATCMLDASTLRFVAVNDALCRLLGTGREPLLARHFDTVGQIGGAPSVPELLAGLRAGHAHFLQREGALLNADASHVPVQLSFTPIRDGHGTVASFMVHIEDIRLRKRAEEQRDHLLHRLEHQATHDTLTGLAHRALLQRALAEVANGQRKADEGASHALCFMDLDGFKQINDSAGHAVGDAALQAVSALFASCIRPGDLLARIGGDEFGAVLWNCQEHEAAAVAERMVVALQDCGFEWMGVRHALGVSIGTHMFGPHESPDRAMAQADAACYAAKRAGRGQVRIAGRT